MQHNTWREFPGCSTEKKNQGEASDFPALRVWGWKLVLVNKWEGLEFKGQIGRQETCPEKELWRSAEGSGLKSSADTS